MTPLLVAIAVLAPAPSDLPLSVPPSWSDRVVYCRTFERADGKAEVCAAGLEETCAATVTQEGMRGRGGVTGQARGLRLRGPALSPHRPLTVSFWWRLRQDATKDTGFNLVQLSGRQGFAALFVRSGPWCGLDRPAAVLQVYYLPGVQNVNAIYDRDVLDRGDLKAGVWHHTALAFSAATLVTAWTDGRKVCDARLVGRPFRVDDGLTTLDIGSGGGPDVEVDEVIVLDGLLTGREIADYATATRQMKEAGYPTG